jgi:hypothetical protein
MKMFSSVIVIALCSLGLSVFAEIPQAQSVFPFANREVMVKPEAGDHSIPDIVKRYNEEAKAASGDFPTLTDGQLRAALFDGDISQMPGKEIAEIRESVAADRFPQGYILFSKGGPSFRTHSVNGKIYDISIYELYLLPARLKLTKSRADMAKSGILVRREYYALRVRPLKRPK